VEVVKEESKISSKRRVSQQPKKAEDSEDG